jgi:hypothetical protein
MIWYLYIASVRLSHCRMHCSTTENLRTLGCEAPFVICVAERALEQFSKPGETFFAFMTPQHSASCSWLQPSCSILGLFILIYLFTVYCPLIFVLLIISWWRNFLFLWNPMFHHLFTKVRRRNLARPTVFNFGFRGAVFSRYLLIPYFLLITYLFMEAEIDQLTLVSCGLFWTETGPIVWTPFARSEDKQDRSFLYHRNNWHVDIHGEWDDSRATTSGCCVSWQAVLFVFCFIKHKKLTDTAELAVVYLVYIPNNW